jgi:hypothetical protein
VGELTRMGVWILGIIGAICLLLYLFVFDTWTVPSSDKLLAASVLPALKPEDVVLVRRGGTPLYGELVRCVHPTNDFRDRWGLIHARTMHPSFYDPVAMRPSEIGIDYLVPIFTRAVGSDDVEVLRSELFDPSHLKMAFHSVNTDIGKRIRYLQ